MVQGESATATRTPLPARRALLATLGLTVGPAVTLGLGRFGYALVLPAMRQDLDWSFATAGALNTANAVGYLLGAMIAAPLAARLGERATFLGGIVVTAIAMAASALTGVVGVLLALRLLAGVGGAACFIAGGGLVARIGLGLAPRRASMLLGVYFAGAAVGIAASGPAVPPFIGWAGWRGAWVLLGAVAVLGLLAAVPAARAVAPGVSASLARTGRWRAPGMLGLTLAYGLFGVGYIAYMTFVVAYLRQAGAGDGEVGAFWSVLGVAGFAASFAFGSRAGGITGGRVAAGVLAVLSVGAAMPLVSTHPVATYTSAVVFGASFLNVITAVTVAAQQLLPPQFWTAAIGRLTIAFATGQCVGPLLAGLLSDGAAGVQAGLGVGVGFLLAAMLVALSVTSRRGVSV